MKKLFTILCSSLYFFAQAQAPGQPIKGVIVKGGKNPGGNILLSLGGGLNNPSNNGKTNANLVNSYAFNGNIYVPLFIKGDNGSLAGETSHFLTIGLNAGGEYFTGSKAYDQKALPSYQVTGQSAAPSIALSSSQNKQNGFRAEAGVQANLSFGKLTLSPMVNAGYLSLQQKALGVTQTGTVNGKAYSKEIYSQEAVKTTGFALVPKLRIAYFPGRFGFYVEGNYTSGPTVNSEAMLFKPQGSANADGFYSQDQLAMGKMQRLSQSTKYNGFGLNFGVSIPLGRSISEKGVKRSEATARKLRGKVTKPGDNGMLNAQAMASEEKRSYTAGRKNENIQQMTVPYTGNSATLRDVKIAVMGTGAILTDGTPVIAGKSVKGTITKGGGAASASYAAGLVIKQPETGDEGSATPDQDGNFEIVLAHDTLHRIYINNEEFGKIKLVTDPNTAERQTPNTSFGKRKPDGNEMMAPGNPIGGIIVKGGKNPGGSFISTSTNSNGEFEFTATEPGNYRFSISDPEPQGKSISEKGLKRTEAAKQTQGKTFGEKVSQGMATARVAGTPIGGIVVKGGKNPGGNLITVTTNGQGEFELEKLEAGNYKFTIAAPASPQGKSISTKGVSGPKGGKN